jgi:acyl-CoA synthetase (AMP-forming)/AMP-acid ligase II
VATGAPRLGCRALAALPAAPQKRERGRGDDLALIQFSSGTTVDPKPVALEQRAVLAQVAALNSFWRHTPESPQSGVSWLPLYHDMGLIGGVFPALALDATMTLLPPERFVARPALWLRALSRHGATISVAPNFAYALATERIADEELAGCDLSRWWLALCGAETVEAETLRRFADRFARWGFRREALTPVYGLSEAALAVTFGTLDDSFRVLRCDREALAERDEAVAAAGGRELVSVGRPLPGFAIELRDEAGAAVGERRVGRLFVAGPSLFRGYFGRPEATARALTNGWLDTGDLGFLADGELFLTGRAKDVLILRGRNHSPADVEQAIDDLVELRRGCAAAVSYHPEGGTTDRLLLFVEHRRGARAEERQSLPARAREAVLQATGLAVDEVHVLAPGTLPRTSSGKIRRGETLRRHLAGELTPPDRIGPLQLAAAFWRGRRALWRTARRATT